MPERHHTGIGMVVLPGGGYGGLAEHEGTGYAEHFTKAGIACFVVSYRLGSQGFRHCWKTFLRRFSVSVPELTNTVWTLIDWELWAHRQADTLRPMRL